MLQMKVGMIDEKLSFDLYYRIFEELTFQDRVRCTSVSQRWRDILLGQWPGMWRHIEYTEANRVEARASPLENEAFFAWLTRAPADGVWSLTCYGDPAFYNTLVRILHRKRFPQLKTLRITCKLEKRKL
ncbi:hypothetical protein BCR43DRAFT_67165 [Syncephalastrum racemosum]|uniref:F-box domain-containing protein n=1 Tax=Syncephalastrum racemosum TaxID=13706 RepID=A0A1X2HWJ3_SYNRA|nr:hypothetical protein BCR43DRAFT_67165 [Syncephalastrum racemosum]